MSPDRPRLLLVDDDDRLRERLERALRDRQIDVYSAPGANAALALASRHAPDYAVLDLRMPGSDGLDLLRRLRAHLPELRTVMLTGYGSIATAITSLREGAIDYLTKPAEPDEILAALGLGNAPGSSHTAPVASSAPAEPAPSTNVNDAASPAGQANLDPASTPTLERVPPSLERVTPSLERVEWEHIQRVLSDCGGNVSQAARVLGLHRRTLQRKLATLPPRR